MEPILINSIAGKSYSIMGGCYRVVISSEDTNHEYAVIEMLVPPGGGPNPHAHKDFHESFYVLEGEVAFTTAAGTVNAGVGSTIVIPKGGAVHSFKNKSDKLARLWCTVVPGGLDKFFAEVGQEVAYGTFLAPAPLTKEDMRKLEEVSDKYGQVLLAPDYWEKQQ